MGKLVEMDRFNMVEGALLFARVFSGEPFGYAWLTPEKATRYCRDLLKTPGFAGFLWVEGERVVGGCLGVVNDYFANAAYDLKEIFVERSEQGKGAGKEMLTAVEDALRLRGVAAVTLITQKHLPAHGFYLGRGYVPSGETVYFCKTL